MLTASCDILPVSRRKESHSTAPLRFAWLGVGVLGLGLGLGLQTLNTNPNTKPSQDTVRIGVCPVTGQSLGSDKSPPRPRHRYSPPQPRRNPCIVCITRASVSVTGLEVTSIVDESPNGYYLIPRRAHSVLKWVDTHTRTATCRALGSIGVRTDVSTLTLTDTPLSNKAVRNPPL